MEFSIELKASQMKLRGEGIDVLLVKLHPRADTFFSVTGDPFLVRADHEVEVDGDNKTHSGED